MRYALFWFLCVVPAAGGIAWLGAQLQMWGISVGISSIAVGICLGMAGVLCARLVGVSHRMGLACGTLLIALVVCAGEHFLLFRANQARWLARIQTDPRAAIFRPEESDDLMAYLRAEAANGRWWVWAVDGVATAISSIAVPLIMLPRSGAVASSRQSREVTPVDESG